MDCIKCFRIKYWYSFVDKLKAIKMTYENFSSIYFPCSTPLTYTL